MSEYDIHIDEIDSSKEKVARAVARVLGDNESAEKELFKKFKDRLDETKSFFVQIDDFSTSHHKNTMELVEKLNLLLNRNVTSVVFGKVKMARGAYSLLSKDSVVRVDMCRKMYMDNEDFYVKVGVSYDAFKDVYEQGIEKVNELNSLIKQINKKMFLYEFKDSISAFKDILTITAIHKKFASLSESYKVNNLNDLLILNTEIDSFFVSLDGMSEEQIKIIEDNKKSFRKRIGAKEDFVLTEKEAKRLKKDIEKVYNSNLYKNLFDSTNAEDFFKRYDYEYSEKNLANIFSLVTGCLNPTAICSLCDFGEGEKPYCVYNAYILNRSSKEQNGIILHESIHALEKQIPKQAKFCVKHKYLNEAMTEYIAKKASGVLEGDILARTRGDNDYEYCCIYDSMMPLVEKLAQSKVWPYLVDAKFNGDIDKLNNIIGKDNIKEISKCFDLAFSVREGNDGKIDQIMKRLDEVLDRVKVKTR